MHTKGKFYSDEQILFSMKEIAEQKTLCEKLVVPEAVSGLSEITKLTDAERIDLYDVLKLASKERKVNKFELETFFTKLAEEEISPDDYIEWLGNARTNLLTDTECTYEEIYSYLKRQNKTYAEKYKKNATWPEKIKFPMTKAQLVKGIDKYLLKLERLRAGLPEKYQKVDTYGRKNGNIAYSISEIEGYDIKGIKAFSKYGSIGENGIKRKMQGWISSPEEGHFSEYVLKVNSDFVVDGEGAFLRINDSERKLIEYYHTILGKNVEANGAITIASERKVCPSCINVIKAFSREYPYLEILIVDGEGGVNILENGVLK